jgi:hypothetical protein
MRILLILIRDLEVRLSEMIADLTLGSVILLESRRTFEYKNKALKSGQCVQYIPSFVVS